MLVTSHIVDGDDSLWYQVFYDAAYFQRQASWPTLRQFIREHDIPHVRLGTLYKIDVAILDEHLQRLARA